MSTEAQETSCDSAFRWQRNVKSDPDLELTVSDLSAETIEA